MLLPLALPAEINRGQLETEGLRIRLCFFFLLLNSNEVEYQELLVSPLQGFSVSFRREFKEGLKAKKKKKKKKRKEIRRI